MQENDNNPSVPTDSEQVNEVPATQPQPVVAQPLAAPQATAAPVHNSPGLLVLQWLTYAFWGWTVLALAWLTSISVSHFVDSSSGSGYFDSMIAYSLAAVIVLFVISLVCDIFYAKQEPEHKTGAAMVIMIIHTVIFALFGIGSLIIAVFAIVRMLIGDSAYSDSSGPMSMLISFAIIAVVYGATLLRTLRPAWLKRAALLYWVFMTVVVVVVTTLGIVGPATQARMTRDDRLIDSNLSLVSTAVNEYANDKAMLPASLDDVKGDLKGDSLSLVERDLVEYKPIGTSDSTATESTDATTSESFDYDLCVTYKAESDYYSTYQSPKAETRETTPATYGHKKGKVCYELTTSYSSQSI